MSKSTCLWALTLSMAMAAPGLAGAQSVCPLNGTASHKLICMLPQALGSSGFDYGLFGILNNRPFPNIKPITQAVGTRLSQLPIASPSSGISVTYDAALKTFVPSTDNNLGPIFGERASTIGPHKLFVGFSYQYFNFDSIDGHKLDNIPLALHALPISAAIIPPVFDTPACNTTGFPADGSYNGSPCLVRDYVKTTYDTNLKVNQYIFYLTYGITRHFEVSTAVPFSNVRMSVVAHATIVPESFAPQPPYIFNRFNFFQPSIAQTPPPPNITVPNCPAAPCFDAVFSDSRSVTGIGDVILRAKYEFYEGERLGIAGGLDARLPTGDEENFLGSGALGLKPFVVFSYRARVSPHASVGYELNGNSLLYGDFIATPTNTKSALPSRFLYVAGADVAVTKRITAAFDLYGQRVFGASQLESGQLADFGACNDSNCGVVTVGSPIPTSLLKSNANISIVDASIGGKVRLSKHLLATGNVLLKLNDSGLRANVVPLAGISYVF
jgi:Putative MetA-pathway of phenol degradation